MDKRIVVVFTRNLTVSCFISLRAKKLSFEPVDPASKENVSEFKKLLGSKMVWQRKETRNKQTGDLVMALKKVTPENPYYLKGVCDTVRGRGYTAALITEVLKNLFVSISQTKMSYGERQLLVSTLANLDPVLAEKLVDGLGEINSILEMIQKNKTRYEKII
jgi:hypothetical protein